MEQEAFYKELMSLQDLYKQAKSIITLAENINDDKKTYVAPFNELRNAFDHVMRAMDAGEKGKYEFNEAREHLNRASYDAYEILASDLGIRIINDIKRFEPSVIALIFPNYYKEYKPQILAIQTNLAEIRALKKVNPQSQNKSFTDYLNHIYSLIEISKKVSMIIPDLDAETERIKATAIKKDKRDSRKVYTTWGIRIAIALVSWCLGYFYYNKHNAEAKPQKTEIQTPILPDTSKK